MVGAAGAQIAFATLMGLCFWWVVRKYVPWFGVARPTRTEIRGLLGLSLWYSAGEAITKLLLASDVIILGMVLSPTAVTTYALTGYAARMAVNIHVLAAGGAIPGIGGVIGLRQYQKAFALRNELLAVTWLFATTIGAAILLWNRSFLTLWVGPGNYAGPWVNLLIVCTMAQTAFVRSDAYVIDATLQPRQRVLVAGIAAALTIGLATLLSIRFGHLCGSRRPDRHAALARLGGWGRRHVSRPARHGPGHRPARRGPDNGVATRARARPQAHVTVPAVQLRLGRLPAAPEQRPLNPLLRWMFLLLVFSIPFEYPDRSFPIEIPTITAGLFLFATLLQPSACYARRPGAVLWFLVYLYMFSLGAALNGRDAVATHLITPDYWAQVFKLFLLELEAVLVFWAAANLLRSPKLAREMLTTLAVACAIFALLPVLGIARTARVQWGGVERITALGQNANTSAMILSAGLIALVGLQYGLGRTSTWRRALGWAVMALIVITVVETGSRISLLALAMGLTVFALGGMHTAWAKVRNAFVTALALGFVVAVAYNSPVMRTRFEDTVEHGALAGRERIYPALGQMFTERPLIGWGPVNNKYELGIRLDERIRRRRDAHNLILEVLSASGLLGAVPFLAGLGLCTMAAWRARRREHGMLAFALLALVMTANMSGNWIASKLLWLILAYGLASATYPPTTVPLPAPPVLPPWPTLPLDASRRRGLAPTARS